MQSERIAYFDCPAGASGNMILAALIDSGVSTKGLHSELKKMNIESITLEVVEVSKMGLRAKHFSVKTDLTPVSRYYFGIVKMIRESHLKKKVKELSLEIFETLAKAESKVHSLPVGKVHFHEVGSIDSIVDIVGTAIALDKLKVKKVYCSALPLGSGFARTSHGVIPLPAPATLEILQDVMITPSKIQAELVTPTGAAIIKCIAARFGGFDAMNLESVGCGAGTMDLEIPNMLRVMIGKPVRKEYALQEEVALLETNIDDMNPELLDYVQDRLFESGAMDVWLAPIYMKKSRPAFALSVISSPEDVSFLAEIIFKETTSFGIRSHRVNRSKLTRKIDNISLEGGNIQVKVGISKDGILSLSPEYEDCAKLAKKSGKPIKEIYDEAKFAASKKYAPRPDIGGKTS